MDITCPQCKTEYEFDDDKVTEAGITVKCTSCDYMFKVRRKAVVETEPVTQPPLAADADPNDRRWMIRTQAGQVYRFKELTTLQQWIVERKVSRDDQISRSGETWKRLGDIAELGSFFQVVDAAMAAAAAPSGPTEAPAPRRDVADEPAFSSDAGQFRDVGPSAAWEENSASISSSDALGDDIPRRRTGRMIGVLVLIALVLGGGVAGFVMRDKIKGLFSGDGGEQSEAFQAGRKLLLMDDEQSLARADQELGRAPLDSSLALAARAEVYTVWAQHLRTEATLLEHKAERLESALEAAGTQKKEEGAPPQPVNGADDPKLARLEAAKLRDEATKKLLQAEIHASAAIKVAADRPEVKRAMADYLRLQGRQPEARTYLVDAARLSPEDPEVLYVEGALEADLGHAEKAETLLKQSLVRTKARQGQSLLRAALLLASLELKAGRSSEAQTQAEAVLQANPNHRWAKQLLEEAKAAAEQVASPTPAPTAPDAGAPPGPTPGKEPPKKPGGERPAPLAGGSYDSLIKQGSQLSERGRTMQAVKAFEQALKLRANGAEALTGLGYCHLDQERFAAAISSFHKALSVSPTYGDALIGMAEAYKIQGNLRKALDYYRAYVTAHPSGAKAVMSRRNVADLERKLGVPAPTLPTPTPGPGPAPGPDPGAAPTPPPPSPSPSPSIPSGVPEKDVPAVPGGQ